MDICRRRAEVVDKSRESSGKVGVGRKDDPGDMLDCGRGLFSIGSGQVMSIVDRAQRQKVRGGREGGCER